MMHVPDLQSGALAGDRSHKPEERRVSKRLRYNRENQPPESAPKPQKATSRRNRGAPNSRSGTSRQKSATMSRPLNATQEREGPALTRTGRISKAKKGLRGFHKCHCGKVSYGSLLVSRSNPRSRVSACLQAIRADEWPYSTVTRHPIEPAILPCSLSRSHHE